MGFNLSILRLFPKNIAQILEKIIDENDILPEEIRVKLGQTLVVRSSGNEYTCSDIIISSDDITHIMMNATNGAFHSVINNIQNGYLSLPNGCRLGICGEGTVRNNAIYNLKHISSLCIRVANQIYGCADSLLPCISIPEYKNTIIIAPPGVGKTTLLRECIRKISNDGKYIGIADERGEVSGMHCGHATFDLGERTDVIIGVPKTMAASMIIRTMSPDILAMDEITAIQDMPALVEAVGCGVGLLTTIHGKGIADLNKPSFKKIHEMHIFDLAVLIEMRNNIRTYRVEKLYD